MAAAEAEEVETLASANRAQERAKAATKLKAAAGLAHKRAKERAKASDDAASDAEEAEVLAKEVARAYEDIKLITE